MTGCPIAAILPGALVIRDPRAPKPYLFLRVGDDVARATANAVKVFGRVDLVREDA